MSGLLHRWTWRSRHRDLLKRARSNEKDSDLFLLDDDTTVPSGLSDRLERRLRRQRLARLATFLLAASVLGAAALVASGTLCGPGC